MQGLIIPWSQVRVLVGLHFVRAGPHRTIPASAYATAFAAAQSDALPSQPLTEIVARVKHSETRDGTFNPGLRPLAFTRATNEAIPPPRIIKLLRGADLTGLPRPPLTTRHHAYLDGALFGGCA